MRIALGFSAILLALSSSAFAGQSGVTYQGRILKPDGSPLAGQFTQFRMQIRTPNSNDCLMYEEIQTLDMRLTSGAFSLTMADGSGTRTDTSGLGLNRLFENRGAFTFAPATCTSGSSYTPSDGDGRNLVVYFKDETMGTWEPIPPQKINYVPYAFSAQSVQGYGADSLLRVVNGSGDPITGLAPLSNTQYTALMDLLNGSSTAYTKAGQLNGVALPTMTTGEVLGWNGTTWVSQAAAGGANSVTTTTIQDGAVTGAKLDPAISISTSGMIASAVTTTRDFKIYAASPSSFYVGMLADPALAASYTLTWPLNAGSANQVLTTDGSGKLTWTTPSPGGVTSWNSRTGAVSPQANDYTWAQIDKTTSSLADLTTRSASDLSSGTLNDSRLSTNVALKNAANDFTNKNTITTATSANEALQLKSSDDSQTKNIFEVRDSGNALKASVRPDGVPTAPTDLTTRSYVDNAVSSVPVGNYVLKTGDTMTGPLFNNTSDAASALAITQSGAGPSATFMGGNVGIGTTSPNGKLDVKGSIVMSGATSGFTGFQPSATAGSTIYTLPSSLTAGGYLTTDGSGNLTWGTPAGTGVTSVTSANTDIGVANTTTTPVLTLNSGTGPDQILKLDGSSKIPAVDGSQLTNLNAGSFTSGTLPVSRGGTGATSFAPLSAIAADTSGNQVAVPGSTSNTMLQWDVTGPKWSTAVWPSSTTANQLLYSSANNVVGQLATANDGVLVTDGSGVPSIAASLPAAVQGNITSVGTIASGTWNGSAIGASYGGTGQTAFTVGDLLYADTTSTLAKLPAAANGYVLTSNGAGTAPSWQAATSGMGGTGTANYLAKFTAGTTLADSALYETGGKVGIGTTAPGSKLTVTGGDILNTSGSYIASDTTVPNVSFTTDKTNALALITGGSPSNGFVAMGHYSTDRFFSLGFEPNYWSASGYISGYGGSSFGTWDDNPFSTNTNLTGFDINSTTSIATYSQGELHSVISGDGYETMVGSYANTYGPEYVLRKARGTYTTGQTAVLNGDDLGTLSFAGLTGTIAPQSGNGTGTDSTGGQVAARIKAGVDSGTIDATNLPGYLSFWTRKSGSAITEAMRIDKDGNVGIGTTSPGYKLDVNGIANATQLCIAGDCKSAWPSAGGSGDFMKDGSVAMTGALQAAAGTAALPSINFGGTNNLGIYMNGGTWLGFSVAGSEVFGIKDDGVVLAPHSLSGGAPTGMIGIDSSDGNKLKWYDGSSWQSASGSDSFAALPCGNGYAPYKSGGTWGCKQVDFANTSSAIIARDGSGSFSANAATLNSLSLNNAGSVVQIQNLAGSAYTLTLPSNTGMSGQVLQTDGAGGLSWAPASSGGTPAGSTGQVQFNNSGSFAASPNLFWDNTNTYLGINGAPTAPLDVVIPDGQFKAARFKGSSWSDSMVSIETGSYGGRAGIELYDSDGWDIVNNGWDGDNLIFSPSNNINGLSSDSVVIARSGNVVIGSATGTTADARLDIRGTTSSTSSIILPRAATGDRPATPVNGMMRYNSTTNKFEAYEASSWKDMIGGGGVGDFMKDGSVAMTGPLKLPNGSTASPSMAFASDIDTGIYRSASDELSVTTGGTQRLKVSNSNTMAYGTSLIVQSAAPTSQVFLTANNTATNGAGTLQVGNGIFSGQLMANNTGSALNGVPNGALGLTSTIAPLTFSTSVNERMRIDSTGNVGIGTTSPGYTLDVNGIVNATGLKINGVDVSAGGGGDFKKDGSVAMTGAFKAAAGSVTAPSISFASDPDTGLYAATADRVTFAAGGAKAFEILGASSAYMTGGRLRATSGTASQPGLGFENDPDSGLFLPTGNQVAFSTDATERMRIDASGHVGIGTSTPNRMLHVVGEISDGLVEFERSNSDTNTSSVAAVLKHTTSANMVDGFASGLMFAIRDSANIDNQIAYLAGQRYGADNSGLFYIQTYNAGTANTQMRIFPDGKVSLATSPTVNPASRLDVRDVNQPTSAGTGIGGIFSTDAQGIDLGGSLTLGGQDGTSSNRAFAQISGRKSNNTSGNYDGYLVLATRPNGGNMTERVRIDAGGNVGIGTTAPETMLDVTGTASFGSTLENTSAYVNSGAAYTIPDTSLNIRRFNVTADTTITLPAFTSTGTRVYNLTVFLKQDATGGRSVTFAGNGSDTIKWDSGMAPPISATAGQITIIQLMKTSDENVWYGSMTWREN